MAFEIPPLGISNNPQRGSYGYVLEPRIHDNEKTACYQTTFHTKFEKTVKPENMGETYKKWESQSSFFKELVLWTETFHSHKIYLKRCFINL